MTRNVLNQLECKIGKAGEILCNTDDTGNVLLFVSSGKLVIYNQNQTPVADVDEGHFVLLPAEKSFIAIAITSTRLILMHAGPLSEMITDDPASTLLSLSVSIRNGIRIVLSYSLSVHL